MVAATSATLPALTLFIRGLRMEKGRQRGRNRIRRLPAPRVVRHPLRHFGPLSETNSFHSRLKNGERPESILNSDSKGKARMPAADDDRRRGWPAPAPVMMTGAGG